MECECGHFACGCCREHLRTKRDNMDNFSKELILEELVKVPDRADEPKTITTSKYLKGVPTSATVLEKALALLLIFGCVTMAILAYKIFTGA